MFDNNVKISLDSPDIFRIRYDSRKDELDFKASFNEVCSIKAYGKKGTLIAKESFYSNKKYPDAFGKSVAAMVDSIDVECSSLSNEKYLCAGDEISCKKNNEKLVIIGGALSDKALTLDEIKALAAIPSMDELRAKLVGLLQAPAAKLARVTKAYSEKEAA